MTRPSASDLERSYVGTYLGLREGDTITPVYVVAITSHEGEMCLGLKPMNREVIPVAYNSPDIVYQYPDLGYAETHSEVFWLERIASRQWRKGIQPKLVRVIDSRGRKRFLKDFDSAFTYNVLDVVYNNRYSEEVQKEFAVVDGILHYRGAKLCKMDDVDTLPKELIYIKHFIGEVNATS